MSEINKITKDNEDKGNVGDVMVGDVEAIKVGYTKADTTAASKAGSVVDDLSVIQKIVDEADEFWQDFISALKEMSDKANKRTNLDSFVKSGIEKLQSCSLQLKTNRRLLKSSLKGTITREKDRQSDRASQQIRRIDLTPVSTPGNKSSRKRGATGTPSPVEGFTPRPSKKIQINENQTWNVVGSRSRRVNLNLTEKATGVGSQSAIKKNQQGIRRYVRPDAVIIEPKSGISYANVLKSIREKVTPESLGVLVKGIRETRSGHLLIEVGANVEDRKKFGDALQLAVGENGTVRSKTPMTWIDIKDLDDATDEEDVRVALSSVLDREFNAETRINLSRRNSRGSRTAFCFLEESFARKLEYMGHVKIGWVNCRIRRNVRPIRCFRCFGYGHVKSDCVAPDRSELCWRCGQGGHRAADCQNNPKCFLCNGLEDKVNVDHAPGSYKCIVYNDALMKMNRS